MILVADAGSTKTDWLFLSKQNEIIPLKSAGLNPVVTTAREIDQRLSAIFKELSETAKVEEIHFFGAGCWNEATCMIIHNALQKYFPNAAIEVDSDIFGAVRASCGDSVSYTHLTLPTILLV